MENHKKEPMDADAFDKCTKVIKGAATDRVLGQSPNYTHIPPTHIQQTAYGEAVLEFNLADLADQGTTATVKPGGVGELPN